MRTTTCLLACAMALSACGGGGGGGASCDPQQSAALTITSTGVTPANVCVTPGGTVTFTNSGPVQHHIEFDNNCATAVDLAPGAQASVPFPTAGNCPYHDSSAGAAFQGVVAVTTVTVTGGY